MNNSTYYPKVQKISDAYGYDAQSRQCIEECAELIFAITKKDRESYKVKRLIDLKEELADVFIMVLQLIYILDRNERQIDGLIEQKINRQLERMKEIKK